MNGKAPQLSWLAKGYEDLDSRDEHGRTDLYIAIVRGQYDCVKILLNSGTKVKDCVPYGTNV